MGFGIETDLRDGGGGGNLFSPPTMSLRPPSKLESGRVFSIYHAHSFHFPLALNIKGPWATKTFFNIFIKRYEESKITSFLICQFSYAPFVS